VVDPRRIFQHALEVPASSIILVHNHPSGNVIPSDAGKQITENLAEGGKLLEVAVPDHIMVGDHQYSRFSDNGIL
jgi:DNA repair protein RadC